MVIAVYRKKTKVNMFYPDDPPWEEKSAPPQLEDLEERSSLVQCYHAAQETHLPSREPEDPRGITLKSPPAHP